MSDNPKTRTDFYQAFGFMILFTLFCALLIDVLTIGDTIEPTTVESPPTEDVVTE